MLRNLFITFLLSIVLIGTVGIHVFTHSCKEDGIFKTYFINISNHCEKKKEQLPLCCQKEKQENDDCCHDETEVFKLKVDYVSIWDDYTFEKFPIPEPNNFIFNDQNVQFDEEILIDSDTEPPPKLTGRQILLKKRVLVI
ncbi:MAG: hypothetical protein FJX84_03320 [Bacteroidetes bacterium]|nr:hypothetical protein [Bacteroidota bacterium]